MKKLLITLSLLVGLAFQTFSQVSETNYKQDLLAKSQRQKKTGFILLGAGGAALALGGILAASGTEEVVNCIGTLNCTGSDGDEWAAGTVLAIAGGLAMLGSVPLFISSGNNKKTASQLSLNSKPIYLPRNTHNGPRSHPALQLTIPLN
jgi:hypothetical protein